MTSWLKFIALAPRAVGGEMEIRQGRQNAALTYGTDGHQQGSIAYGAG